MEKDIISKLKDHIQKTLVREADIVYLFVEVRKLMYLNKLNWKNYPALAFFCNWVVHTELSKESASAEIKEWDRIMAGQKPKRIPVTAGVLGEGKEKLPILLEDFNKFLNKFDLPTSFIDDDNSWNNFTDLLLEVIFDCPISSIDSMGHVYGFVVKRNDEGNLEIIHTSSKE